MASKSRRREKTRVRSPPSQAFGPLPPCVFCLLSLAAHGCLQEDSEPVLGRGVQVRGGRRFSPAERAHRVQGDAAVFGVERRDRERLHRTFYSFESLRRAKGGWGDFGLDTQTSTATRTMTTTTPPHHHSVIHGTPDTPLPRPKPWGYRVPGATPRCHDPPKQTRKPAQHTNPLLLSLSRR